ncbi:NAD-dependent epimerase/dehydratase family protein [Leptospira langatensis]|uniref:NAD-dependent epimerase/dehydratase family protein n=1 Tax=Leptospira langatensis TaxID=2484983 RepID=A0A5F1ZZ73_9LEPT|nr:NAD-dependent epimerase/dehydratase family protein [Leptospira langatensis]TGJ98448.1 NAD-dependent epimerase/dehydratase family protein [Leptospira langatensis]TGL43363.1 NAD-dependent epimerase/dehydratase family protein [Leptospira langatensis]
MKIKVIITGATGMVGEGVLLECLEDPDIESILLLNRKASGFQHPKIKEIVHTNFLDISSIANELKGYDACFFCLGVSSVGMKEEEYFKLTHTLTMHVAEILAKQNPKMSFCYISGAHTDSTEKGRTMWARVKGKVENDLQKLPFARVYNFRPGYMQPSKGAKNTLSAYKYISWTYPVLKRLFPDSVSTLQELALAMIHSVTKGTDKRILEVRDILELAKK